MGHLDTACVEVNEWGSRLGPLVFDALAGHVVYVARQRGWPALTDDPGRLHRVDPGLEVELL